MRNGNKASGGVSRAVLTPVATASIAQSSLGGNLMDAIERLTGCESTLAAIEQRLYGDNGGNGSTDDGDTSLQQRGEILVNRLEVLGSRLTSVLGRL